MHRWGSRFLLLGLLGALGFGGWLAWYAMQPMRVPETVYPIDFSVQPGVALKTASASLYQNGVLTKPWAFVLLARLKGQAGAIKAGSYALEGPVSPLQLLRKITEGDTVLGKLALIEGWTFRDMRRSVAANPSLRHDTADMSDAELMKAVGAGDLHPEGLFFPDTYFFDRGSSELALYKRAYSAMRDNLNAQWALRAPTGLPYRSPYEVLIMASIIEKETGAAEERPRIAAVFLNRLRIGMRLQTDPTVIYGLGAQFDGNLRRDDLLTDTPYNTYTRGGLPPTPIALPGLAAIQAALQPDRSKSLYFVAKGNGRHVFSETLDAHNRAVIRYQKGR
ncbi:MAG: aminodeoxychorismate lyase [Hydrogenophilales bacterium 28-61-23]|nr:MAG: aminodeoxychorismate lyase [Hydrogenophilales bacterium 28-61-23]